MLIYSSWMKNKTIPWALIQEQLDAIGKTRDWLEASLDVEKNVITNWKSRGVPKGRAAELGLLLGTSADFLLGIEAIHPISAFLKKKDAIPTDELENVSDDPSPTKKLPVVGTVQAGGDGLLTIDDYPSDYGNGYVNYWTKCESAYALKIRGESMSPRYLPGEYVGVDPCSEVNSNEEVIIQLKDGRRLIKRLLWKNSEQASFESINKDYQNITLEIEEIDSLHKVLGHIPKIAFNHY